MVVSADEPANLQLVLKRMIQQDGAVRVLIRPVARFRALVSHVILVLNNPVGAEDDTTTHNQPPPRVDDETNHTPLIGAIRDATRAMDICETRPLQALLFHEYYTAQINRAVDLILEQFFPGNDNNDPIVQYIRANGTDDDVLPDPIVILRQANTTMMLQTLQRQGIIVDHADFQAQLLAMLHDSDNSHGRSLYQFQERRDQDIIAHVQQLVQRLSCCPVATILGNHQDWNAVQRNIRNSFRTSDFETIYESTLPLHKIHMHFRIDPNAYSTWAKVLKQAQDQKGTVGNNDENMWAKNLYRQVQTVRLFFFELYRKCQSGFICWDELKTAKDKWFLNGLLSCIQADRAYTLFTRRMDWIRTSDIASHPYFNANTTTRTTIATIHPIYEWYLEEFPILGRNNPLQPTACPPEEGEDAPAEVVVAARVIENDEPY
jgi:hypothetical protein